VVQVVQVDLGNAEPSQASLAPLPHVGRAGPNFETARDLISPYQPELAGQQHLVAGRH
jgi:hypothetical protein